MPEAGFTIQLSDIQEQVAFFLYGTRKIDRLSPDDNDNLAAVIKNGLRRFYYPKQVGGLHDWSFLRSKLTVKLSPGTDDYEMPADFGGSEGDLVHDSADTVLIPVRKVTESRINHLRSILILTTSWPRFYAERAVSKGGRQGQRWELMMWPDPGATYTLYGTYRVLPLAPGNANPYLYGGPEHAQTILEACLAQAELQLDGAPGAHAAEFADCLQTSILLDQTNHAPENLGYNGNGSPGGMKGLMRDASHFEQFSPVTYGGVAY